MHVYVQCGDLKSDTVDNTVDTVDNTVDNTVDMQIRSRQQIQQVTANINATANDRSGFVSQVKMVSGVVTGDNCARGHLINSLRIVIYKQPSASIV